MRFVLFYHSLVSDWNHGNAHFLRGIVAELLARGHAVRVLEPADGWSVTRLRQDAGEAAIAGFHRAFPDLSSETYDAGSDIAPLVDGADVVIAHEWNSTLVLEGLAHHRARDGRFLLLFHDTHHRAISQPEALARLPLDRFDGVLAYGAALRDQYQKLGWGRRVWVWHEAADTRVFRPRPSAAAEGDVVWIGNWGDDERVEELREFLFDPVRTLRLGAAIYGVRYPGAALELLAASGIDYRGWLPNYAVPEVFGRYCVTVHVPRRPYVRMLPGIPTIRPFEAMACGIPLISAPWHDSEGLFRAGEDYVRVSSGAEMTAALRDLLSNAPRRAALATNGLRTIQARHTCAHRVDELLTIVDGMRQRGTVARMVADAARTSQGPDSGNGMTPPPS